jgi:signal transduction histidine kinase
MSARIDTMSLRNTAAPGAVATATALDDRLGHVQRLVLQGELAATAVHEISNLLTIVLFNAGLLRPRLRDDPAGQRHIEAVLHAAGVIGSLCSQLRNLSRPTPAQYRVVDLVENTRRTFTLLEQILQRRLSLEVGDGSPVLICAEPAHLDQILVNLVLNARDATNAEDGRIRIRIGLAPGTGREPRERYLEVTDNGTGMTAAVRRRIFQPFFTTKPVERGTGLGLVTVRRLVHGMGGRIRLTSRPGRGTTLRLLFPAPPPGDVADYHRAALERFAS